MNKMSIICLDIEGESMRPTRQKKVKNITWNPEALKAYRKYQAEFNKEFYKSYNFRFNRETDKFIIDKLSEVPNATDYLRKLISDDIAKEREKEQKRKTSKK